MGYLCHTKGQKYNRTQIVLLPLRSVKNVWVRWLICLRVYRYENLFLDIKFWYQIQVFINILLDQFLSWTLTVIRNCPIVFQYFIESIVIVVWLLISNCSSKTTHFAIPCKHYKSSFIICGMVFYFSILIYLIPNPKPEYGDVCRGSQKKVHKSAPSIRL